MAITEEQLKKELADAKNKRAKGLQLDPIEVQAFVVSMLTQFIKYNFQLQDLDLSNTGLTELTIRALGINIRRSKSLLSLHLSDNPGVT
jgi:hypothetical protein